ncbi:MAG TPA: F0F1 ATP synthase subunit A [Acidimicrobiales bacterium]|nr:F0F1 ATP synthase subunit A [Acidimicrobiales bacterium]
MAIGGALLLLRSLVAVNIAVGTHVEGKIFGITVDLDTLWATGAAVVVVIALGLLLRRQATSGVPRKFQLVWEMGVNAVRRQVEGSIGPAGLAVVPLATALFVFIFVANFFEIFGVGSKYEVLGPPTSNVNLPAALAIFVIVLVHIASIRTRGIVGYVRHYLLQPFPKFLFPVNLFINLVEEIAKPITLALRLFGNLFSGALMLTLIAALGAWKLGPVPIGNFLTFLFDVIWKLFDVFLIGPIQAFIFALLTILYFDTAMSTADHH